MGSTILRLDGKLIEDANTYVLLTLGLCWWPWHTGCNSSPREAEATAGPRVWGQSGLHNESETTWDYRRCCCCNEQMDTTKTAAFSCFRQASWPPWLSGLPTREDQSWTNLHQVLETSDDRRRHPQQRNCLWDGQSWSLQGDVQLVPIGPVTTGVCFRSCLLLVKFWESSLHSNKSWTCFLLLQSVLFLSIVWVVRWIPMVDFTWAQQFRLRDDHL